MLNPLSFFSKLIKSSNQKELDRIGKIVSKINILEKSVKELKDDEFTKKTIEFKERINDEKIVKLKYFKKFLLILLLKFYLIHHFYLLPEAYHYHQCNDPQ